MKDHAFMYNEIFRGARGGDAGYMLQNVMEQNRTTPRRRRPTPTQENMTKVAALARVILDKASAFDWGNDEAWASDGIPVYAAHIEVHRRIREQAHETKLAKLKAARAYRRALAERIIASRENVEQPT